VKYRRNNGDSLAEIIVDDRSPLSALFKYALLYSENRPDLAEGFKDAAKEQLFFEPLYAKYLGQWLPKEFVNG
jgi:hypothetical protein